MSRAFRVYSSAHLTSNVDRVKSFAWVIKSPTKFITALPTLLCAFILSFFPSICFAAIYQENFEGQFISSGYGSIPANWTATGSSLASYSKSSEHFEGNYSLAAVVSYDSQYYAVLNRSISGLTPGKVLNISVRVKCTTSSRAEGAVGFTSGATQTSNNTVWFSSSQEWHTLQLTGVVVPSSGTLNIWLKMANDSGASTFYWDCLTIADIGSCFDTVQKAYIGYYQRPADPEGLLYWAGRLEASGGNLTDIIEAFANSQESQTLYGPINNTTISGVINAIYRALFNRDAEPGGLAWYANGFSTGQYTAATIMLNVLYGAQNDDLQSINNKLSAANLFTKAIDPELDGSNFKAIYEGNIAANTGRLFLAQSATAVKVPTQWETEEYLRSYLKPTPPLAVAAQGCYEKVHVTWNNNGLARSFNVYWSSSNGVTQYNGTKLGNTVVQGYFHGGLQTSQTYYYIVTAVNGAGESTDSLIVSATTRQYLLNVCDLCTDNCTCLSDRCVSFSDNTRRCVPEYTSYYQCQ